MDAVDAKCDELNVMDAICYAVYEGQKLEIQLNEANQRIKQLEEELMDTKNKHAVLVADVVLNEDRAERIKHLEDIINRAHLAFFSDSSDRKVSIAMHRILDEEVRKESQ
jgi:hypothetical protein